MDWPSISAWMLPSASSWRSSAGASDRRTPRTTTHCPCEAVQPPAPLGQQTLVVENMRAPTLGILDDEIRGEVLLLPIDQADSVQIDQCSSREAVDGLDVGGVVRQFLEGVIFTVTLDAAGHAQLAALDVGNGDSVAVGVNLEELELVELFLGEPFFLVGLQGGLERDPADVGLVQVRKPAAIPAVPR